MKNVLIQHSTLNIQITEDKTTVAIRDIGSNYKPEFVDKTLFYKHVDKEDKGVAIRDSLGGRQKTTIINDFRKGSFQPTPSPTRLASRIAEM